MNPQTIAVAAAAAGTTLAVAGVYLLAGTGWALISGAVACFALAAVLLRGLTSSGEEPDA